MTSDPMDDSDSPYRPPAPEPPPETLPARCSFREALARGFAATNDTLGAVLLIFLLMAPQQATAAALTAMTMRGDVPFQPGDPLSPRIATIFVLACTTCVWLAVIVFAYPWIMGGAVGQLRDHVVAPRGLAGRFKEYARRFYVRMLAMFLVYLAFLTLCYVLVFFASSIVVSRTARGFEQSQAEFMRAISLDPLNLAVSAGFLLVVTAASLLMNLGGAAVAVEDRGAMKAIARALAFCRNHRSDATKIYLINVCVVLPQIFVDRLGTLFAVTGAPELIALSTVTSALMAYTVVLNVSFAIAVYVVRRPPLEPAA